ncbi:hypothetical protein IAU60_002152 [Kwoniella sp. DSM 27419]
MFKKRSRPASVRDKPKEEGPGSVAEEDKVASGSGSPPIDEEEGEDTGRTIEELVMLRKLRKMQSQQGIDLVKLNRGGEKKAKGKKRGKDGEGDAYASDQYGLQPGKGRAADDKDEDEDENDRAKRLVRQNNFTQRTNALDVDKHMMAYIESELVKRRGGAAASGESKDDPNEPYDPQADLYKLAEKYRFESKKGAKKEDDEGNVTNSLGMLTSIPEVDLGMDNRLRNIEMTEKAKRDMMEERKQAAIEASMKKPEDEDYAAARFYRPYQRVASDIYAINEAKRAEAGLPPRQENATDEQVYDRFIKRTRR